MKYLSLLLTTCLVFFLFPKNVYATISISATNVPTSVNLDQEFTVDINLACTGCGISYLRGVFFNPESSTSYSGFTQNNSGDWINLSGSPSSYFKIDSGSFSGQMKFKFDSIKPAGNYFFKVGRYTPSGSSFSQNSENISITVIDPSPTPSSTPTQSPTESPAATVTPTSTPTPTASPTPAKSTYKINKPKDENNQEISSVKIYIDNLYTHHLDDEILEFCDTCFCDDAKTIPCGFGQHTIKLSKSGFSDWSELQTFIQNTTFEITPILTSLPQSTPTPTVSIATTNTPTPTSKSSPTPTINFKTTLATFSASISGILGISTDSSRFIIASDSEAISTNGGSTFHNLENKILKYPNYKTTFFIGILISVSSGALLYFRLKKG